jgi:hypothetical protein
MVYFQTKNPTWSKFWKALQWKILVHFTDIWSILRTFGLFYGHLVYFTDIWYILWLLWSFGTYIFSRFGMLHQERSGNPDFERSKFCHHLRLLITIYACKYLYIIISIFTTLSKKLRKLEHISST